MAWVAGADGCRAGWLRASRETASGELHFQLLERPADLLGVAPEPEVLAVDIPIGLPRAGRRDCDVAARRALGAQRGRSVFPAPIRAALAARSRSAASALTARRDGRAVSCQAWALVPKIRAVDALLRSDLDARRRVHEAHPELCFRAWNGGRPMAAPKRSEAGRHERVRLAEAWLGRGVLARARGGLRRSEAADDDVLDAIAVLWTATRIHAGEARSLPARPPADAMGLPMQIVY